MKSIFFNGLQFLGTVTFSLFLGGCTNNRPSDTNLLEEIIVHVGNESHPISLSSISPYGIISLETTDSALVGEISKIATVDDALFVSDRSKVFRFDTEGKLVSLLSKKGEGPEEYTGLTDFVPLNENQVVILNRGQQKLLQYSMDGSLQKQVRLDYWIDRFTLSSDGTAYLYSGNETSDYENSQLHLMDWNTGEITGHLLPVDEPKSMYLHVHDRNPLTGGQDIRFTQTFNDTVYAINGASITPRYVISWDGHNVPRAFFDGEYVDIMDFFQKFHQDGTYAYGITPFVESPTNYWIGYYYQKQYHLAIVDKKSGECTITDNLVLDKIADMPLNIAEKQVYALNDGSLVIPIEAGEVLEYLEKVEKAKADEVLAQLKIKSENDNPLLLVISPR